MLFFCECSLTRNTTQIVVINITIKPNIGFLKTLFLGYHGYSPILILSQSSITKREEMQYCEKTVIAPDMGLEPMTLRLKVGCSTNWGPVHTYPDIFESATFSFRIRLPSPSIRWIRQRIRIFLNLLSRVEKNKSATNPIMYGRENRDIFESDDVSNSCRSLTQWTINQYGDTTATTGHICRHYRALYSVCSEHLLLQRSPRYYSESAHHRVRLDRRIRFEYATCGQGYFWIRKEKVADSKISEYV